jgi:hypothetical protein
MAAEKVKNSFRNNVAQLCSRETWRKPHMMHIFISFFLYMLATAFSNATIPLVRPSSLSSSLRSSLSLSLSLSPFGKQIS